jgi:alkanesulfonate monooxygenase SsuD/methylene tetrahydromethanopterin reductase-like flavin-dependent oxidoreductase (luciferase family)
VIVARYDLRLPPGAITSPHELYAAALEQAAYCDAVGFDALVLSEHHGVADGYLPSPLVMAAAMVARTTRIPINVAALLPALHDPLRLAEDIAVLDLISAGRVSYVFGLGYRPEEYEMFERDWAGRGDGIEAAIRTLFQAWTGEPFEYRGRTVSVTPRPCSRPQPFCFYGGASKAAARRAARLELAFFPQSSDPALAELYAAECRAHGREPGLVMQPPPGPGVVFCSTDPDTFWARHGEHLLHDARSYDQWHGDLDSHVRDRSASVDEMARAGVYVVWTPEQIIESLRSGEVGAITAHPLCGGLPPEASWESLRLLGDVVKPALG